MHYRFHDCCTVGHTQQFGWWQLDIAMLLHHLHGRHGLPYVAQLFNSLLTHTMKVSHLVIKAWKPDFTVRCCSDCCNLYMPPPCEKYPFTINTAPELKVAKQ